jgi:transposase, IS30 family
MEQADRKYTHITLIERGQIEAYRKQGLGINQIAKLLNRSKSTISDEVKRGTVHQIKNDKDVYIYYATTAQVKYEKARKQSACLRFDEKYSAEFFKQLEVALKEKPRVHSVDTFVNYYKQEHPEERVPSTNVVYRLIDDGKLSIKSIHLPKKPSRRPKKTNSITYKGSNKKVLGTSIQQRPASVETRVEFGHYEADLVIGKKGSDEPVVLTLVERKSRLAYVRKVDNRTSKAVQNVLLDLIDEVGIHCFKSITFDNGSEFSTMSELVGIDVYFAHAYSAFERGSNENFNGLLREYMPKSTSFHEFSEADIAVYQDCINNKLRKILGYKSATQVYAQALAV